ncbi:MAG: phosphoadenylyl-sulfate reductase [Bacteroidetes bacterium]|nr:phosphoadenylyl-sulfate reductase [Bacteroidota bacterium]
MAFEQEIDSIRIKINQYKSEGKKLFAGSSFQTHSIPMLHILAQIDNTIPIYFLNTGYLFPQTIEYKDKIAQAFGINVIDLKSPTPRNMQKDGNGRLLFTSDPDFCCHLNKVVPMEPILNSYDVWINGVRADQNANRANMKEEQATPQRAMRYHPMLRWTKQMIWKYIKEYNLPHHPLDAQGYTSIGCEPCTRKVDPTQMNDERMSRWFGLNKTECGLHTELIK